MSTDELADFYVHQISVQTLTGTGGMGDVFADPVQMQCLVEEKLVRSPLGNEVFSETKIYAAPMLSVYPSSITYPGGVLYPSLNLLTEGSQVTLPSGDVATVTTAAVHNSGSLGLPDHVEALVK